MSLSIILAALPAVLHGLWLTLLITAAAFLIGQVMAPPIALARRSRFWLLNATAFAYTFLLRGSPLLVQLFIVYYGFGQIAVIRHSFLWTFFREPLNCAVFTIGLNSAAYMAEVIAGSLKTMPRGQSEAARSLGIAPLQTVFYVLLPQVYRLILPLIGNELILVLKSSSLASTVTIVETTGAARLLVARTFAPFEIFTVAGLVYLLVGLGCAQLFGTVERVVALPGSSRRAA